MMKNVDYSLYRAVDMYLNDELPLGTIESIGIAEGGVGLADNDIYYDNTPENVLDLIDAVTEAVEAGDIDHQLRRSVTLPRRWASPARDARRRVRRLRVPGLRLTK